MRILFLCQHYYPDMVSTGLHMTELSTRMLELQKDWYITAFCAESARTEFAGTNLKQEIYEGVNIVRVSNTGELHGSLFSRAIFGISFLFKSIFYIFRKSNNFDLILLTTNPPFLGIAPLLLKFFLKKKYILIVYDIHPDIEVALGIIKFAGLFRKIWSKFNKIVYHYADAVVVIGDDMSEIIRKSMKKANMDRIKLIHNWSDKRVIYPIERSSNQFIKKYDLYHKKILLYSGTMGRTHNIEPILQAASELKDHRDIKFIFIGSGYKKETIAQHIESNQLQNVLLLPYQPLEMLAHTQSAASLSFVCLEKEFTGLSVPSKSYGIMAAKVPLVGLLDNDSEIAKTIEKYNCGVVWNENSKLKLSQILLQTLSNDTLITEMANNSLRAFEENFDLSISAQKYNDLMSEIIETK